MTNRNPRDRIGPFMRQKLIDSGRFWTDEDYDIYRIRKSESLNEMLAADRAETNRFLCRPGFLSR